ALGVVLIAWNRHPAAGPIDCILVKHAGRLARGVANEMPVERIGDSFIKAQNFACLRVDDRTVIVRVKEKCRAIRHHGIEGLPVEILLAENAGIPAAAIYPGTFGMSLGKIADELLEFRNRPRRVEFDVQGELQATILQMQMRVLKAG